MATLLTDEEKEALKGLSHLQRCLYVFGIRWYMDSKTRVTGVMRGISYQSLAEEMHVEPFPGLDKTGTPSRWAMMRAVEALEKAGLIINKSQGKKLILECVLAPQSQSVQKKAAPRPHQQAAPQAAPDQNTETSIKIDNLDKIELQAATQAAPSPRAQAARPPLSNISVLTNLVGDTLKSYPQGSLRQIYLDLLQTRNYAPGGLIHPQTGAMLTVWESEGVLAEDVQTGMQYAEEYENNGVPKFPFYYKKFVLSAMKARLEAQQEINRPAAKSIPKAAENKTDSLKSLREKWLANLVGTEFDDGTFGDLSAYAKPKQSS